MTYKILTEPPKGWKEDKRATHHPKGAKWFNNGKSRFGGEYEYCLVIVDQDLYNKTYNN